MENTSHSQALLAIQKIVGNCSVWIAEEMSTVPTQGRPGNSDLVAEHRDSSIIPSLHHSFPR